MKKPMSTMTSAQFEDYFVALRLTGVELAAKLERTPAMVSWYRSGRAAIPLDIHRKMRDLLAERAAHIGKAALDIDADLSAIVGASTVFHNTYEKRERKPWFNNRVGNAEQREKETRLVLAAYRITQPRLAILRQGIVALHNRLAEQAKAAPDSESVAEALADLKAVAVAVYGLDKVTPPFTMRPTYAQWRVISAAIRAVPGNDAYSFYQHWRRHKGSGWPYRSQSLNTKEES